MPEFSRFNPTSSFFARYVVVGSSPPERRVFGIANVVGTGTYGRTLLDPLGVKGMLRVGCPPTMME